MEHLNDPDRHYYVYPEVHEVVNKRLLQANDLYNDQPPRPKTELELFFEAAKKWFEEGL